MWLSETSVHGCEHVAHTRVLWHFSKQPDPLNFELFSLLKNIARTSNSMSAQVGEQQFSRAIAPDPPTFSTDRQALLQQEPSLQLRGGCKNKAAPCSTAAGLLDPGHARLPRLTAKQARGNREQPTVGGPTGLFMSSQMSFTHLDPFRRVYFGCSKHTSSTL